MACIKKTIIPTFAMILFFILFFSISAYAKLSNVAVLEAMDNKVSGLSKLAYVSVILLSPADYFEYSTYDTIESIGFSCQASSTSGINNMTFYLKDSSQQIIYQETKVLQESPATYTYNVNVPNIFPGNYSWNCEAYDSDGNYASATSSKKIIVYKTGHIYAVIAIDTEPSGYEGIIFHGTLIDKLKVFCKGCYYNFVENVFDKSWRYSHNDSSGKPPVFTWYAMTYSGLTFNSDQGSNAVFNALEGQYIGQPEFEPFDWNQYFSEYGDNLEWHNHHAFYDSINPELFAKWTQLETMNGTMLGPLENITDIYTFERSLNKLLIDKLFFPSSFRSGWVWENNDYSNFLEEIVIFDFSNLAGLERGYGNGKYDWSIAPTNWGWYHPSYNNYQLPGNMKRYIFKCDGIGETIQDAFARAWKGENIAVCKYTHSFADMVFFGNSYWGELEQAKNSYPEVDWLWKSADDAARLDIGLDDTTPPEISLSRQEGFVFITTNEPIFNPYPYCAYNSTEDNMYYRLIPTHFGQGDNVWVIDVSEVPYDRLVCGVSDNAGNTAVGALGINKVSILSPYTYNPVHVVYPENITVRFTVMLDGIYQAENLEVLSILINNASCLLNQDAFYDGKNVWEQSCSIPDIADAAYYDLTINIQIMNPETVLSGSNKRAVHYIRLGPNNPPVFNTIGDKIVYEDQGLSFFVTATDPEQEDVLTYSTNAGTILPPPFSFIPTTGHFIWLPSFSSSGIYPIIFTVTDGEFFDEENITITVINVNRPPQPASNPSPSFGMLGVSLSPQLSWIGNDPDHDDILVYDIYFGSSSEPPLVAEKQSQNTFLPGILEPGKGYYWKIATFDSYNETATNSIPWFFTTLQTSYPYLPSNPFPYTGSIGISIENITLSWEGGDPDGDAVTYDIYFGSSSEPPLVEAGLEETSYNVEFLEPGTQYFWRITSKDYYGAATTGDLWNFQTITPDFYICGDVNNDGAVNLLDVLFLIDYLYGNPQGLAPDPLQLGDVNMDGIINLIDIIWLINYKYDDGPSPVQESGGFYCTLPRNMPEPPLIGNEELIQYINQVKNR